MGRLLGPLPRPLIKEGHQDGKSRQSLQWRHLCFPVLEISVTLNLGLDAGSPGGLGKQIYLCSNN